MPAMQLRRIGAASYSPSYFIFLNLNPNLNRLKELADAYGPWNLGTHGLESIHSLVWEPAKTCHGPAKGHTPRGRVLRRKTEHGVISIHEEELEICVPGAYSPQWSMVVCSKRCQISGHGCFHRRSVSRECHNGQ